MDFSKQSRDFITHKLRPRAWRSADLIDHCLLQIVLRYWYSNIAYDLDSYMPDLLRYECKVPRRYYYLTDMLLNATEGV